MSEQVLPNSVHRHAAGEGILVAGEPVGQLRAAADVWANDRRLWGDDRDEPARNDLAPVMSITADAGRHRSGTLVIIDRHRQRWARNRVLFRSRYFLLQCCEPLLDLLEVGPGIELLRRLFFSGFS